MPNSMRVDRFARLKRLAVPLLRPYATRISVFGSYARGEETDRSDIDLLVDLKPSRERPLLGFRWFAIEEELGLRLGRRVELVTRASLSPHVRPYVEGDEVVLYGAG